MTSYQCFHKQKDPKDRKHHYDVKMTLNCNLMVRFEINAENYSPCQISV